MADKSQQQPNELQPRSPSEGGEEDTFSAGDLDGVLTELWEEKSRELFEVCGALSFCEQRTREVAGLPVDDDGLRAHTLRHLGKQRRDFQAKRHKVQEQVTALAQMLDFWRKTSGIPVDILTRMLVEVRTKK